MEIGGAEGDGGGILHSHMEFGGDRQDWISRRGIGKGISKGVKGVPSALFLVQPPGDRAELLATAISGVSAVGP